MGVKTLFLTDRLYEYLCNVAVVEPEPLRALRLTTARSEEGVRQSSPEQAQLMGWLVELIGARRVLDVGTFHGYSALAMALALPADGEVITCDVNADWAQVGVEAWKRAGLDHQIHLHLGPALDTLNDLIAVGQRDRFDFAYLDADKVNHDAYLEMLLRLVRPGGLIVINNFFVRGLVTEDPETNSELDEEGVAYVTAVQALNRKLRDDERISVVTVPLSDGITLVRRR